jgi:hypothetical protein
MLKMAAMAESMEANFEEAQIQGLVDVQILGTWYQQAHGPHVVCFSRQRAKHLE